jgi:hypothetical protein
VVNAGLVRKLGLGVVPFRKREACIAGRQVMLRLFWGSMKGALKGCCVLLEFLQRIVTPV